MHTHWLIFGITKAVSWKEQNKWGNFCHVLLWAAHGIIHDLISNLSTGSYMTISKVGGGAWRTSSMRISKVVYVNYQSSGVVVTVITKLLLLLLLTWEEEIKHKWHHRQTHILVLPLTSTWEAGAPVVHQLQHALVQLHSSQTFQEWTPSWAFWGWWYERRRILIEQKG